MIWLSLGEPAMRNLFPTCQPNCLEPPLPMENDSFELALFPLLSTVVCNLNLVLGRPLVSYITNFPAKTMLVLMERREGQLCFLSKPHEGRNNVCYLLSHPSQGQVHRKSSGRICWRKGGSTNCNSATSSELPRNSKDKKITQANGTPGEENIKERRQ